MSAELGKVYRRFEIQTGCILLALSALALIATIFHISTWPSAIGIVFSMLVAMTGYFAAWQGTKALRGRS